VNRGYVSGLVTGALIGGALVMWLAPQLSDSRRERIADAGRGVGRQARHWWQQGRETAEGLMDRI